jgi:hypothetical protein
LSLEYLSTGITGLNIQQQEEIMPIGNTNIKLQEVNLEIGQPGSQQVNITVSGSNSLVRLLANKPTGQVRWSDFIGKSLVRHWGGTLAFDSCSTSSGNFLNISSIFGIVANGTKFRVVLGQVGSWADPRQVHEYYITKGVAASYENSGFPGFKKQIIQGLEYDGVDQIYQKGYYIGSSTKFPCSTQHFLTLQLLGVNGSGSGTDWLPNFSLSSYITVYPRNF